MNTIHEGDVQSVAVRHTCGWTNEPVNELIEHIEVLELTAKPLKSGAIRWVGFRCDGTPIHVYDRELDDEAVA